MEEPEFDIGDDTSTEDSEIMNNILSYEIRKLHQVKPEVSPDEPSILYMI